MVPAENLNMEASLTFQTQRRSTLRIFLSEHKWKDGLPTEEEAIMMLNQGDDSAIPVPAVFMFVPGMPVVVNRNTHQGLKLVNGASYTAAEVIVDKAHPGIASRPAWRSTSGRRRQSYWGRRRPRTSTSVSGSDRGSRTTGTLERVALELRGTRTTNVGGRAVPSQCDPYSLYVQLSRCPTLDGIMLVSKVRRGTWWETGSPGDDRSTGEAGGLSDRTVREALRWLGDEVEAAEEGEAFRRHKI
ncbi:PIF1 protein [Hirsutella rhossiliensis]|uniref:PIF1 protein n=1 Tax=Hirsutella rhossiliensis TaxID=111463 RepID=A0A9P8MMD4_9HYPO|nr:PIF1 protein [Hirsutella rhossiliensis]KAH0957044.1 PIF1 protein [Hirsutella rhossiliensis]